MLRRRIVFIVALILLAIALAIAVAYSSAALQVELLRTAGLGSEYCGFVGLKEDPGDALSCFELARAKGRPARVLFELQGIDSRVLVGLAAAPGASVVRVDSDSPLYPLLGFPRLTKSTCRAPAFQASIVINGIIIPAPRLSCGDEGYPPSMPSLPPRSIGVPDTHYREPPMRHV